MRDAAPDSLRVTHLLYNNLGSHGRGGDEVFQRRLASIRQAGAEVGLQEKDSLLEQEVVAFGQKHGYVP